MLDLELLLLIVAYTQPIIIGVILYIASKPGLVDKSLFTLLQGTSRRQKGVRFFECAAHPSLSGQVSYDLSTLTFGAVFIIYDIDLFFFLAEATCYEWWSTEQACVFALYLAFFLAGVWYDTYRFGFFWG